MVATPLADHQAHYLTSADLAARYHLTASTIRYWRHIGYGPRGIKIGRQTLYPIAEVERFEREQAAKESA